MLLRNRHTMPGNVIDNMSALSLMTSSKNLKKVTIKDVAHAAGVSTQTVSRVINHHSNVAPQTRVHVRSVIDELGYAPNVIAKSLSSGKSNTLGVIGFGLEYYGSTSILRGIEKKANETGFSILLSLLDDYEMGHVDRILHELFARQVEGIIWSIPGIGKTLAGLTRKFSEVGIPVVFLNKEQTENNMVVALDNRRGGRLATTHLLENGYRRIGIITGPAGWWEARERECGWAETLQEAGIPNLDRLKVEGDWTPQSGERGLHALLAQAADLDAVFVSNDQMALGALQAARNLGIRIPQDLGVVGFDDIPEAPYFYPALSTVRQNARRLGALAVEKLNDHLSGAQEEEEEFAHETVWLEPQLIIRESSLRTPLEEK